MNGNKNLLQIIFALIVVITTVVVVFILYKCFKSKSVGQAESVDSFTCEDSGSKNAGLRKLILEKSRYNKFFDEIVMKKFFPVDEMKKLDGEYSKFTVTFLKLPKGDELLEGVKKNLIKFQDSSSKIEQGLIDACAAIKALKKRNNLVDSFDSTLGLITDILVKIFTKDFKIPIAMYCSNGKDFLKISENLANLFLKEMSEAPGNRSLYNISECYASFPLIIVPENLDINFGNDTLSNCSYVLALNILNRIYKEKSDMFRICGNERRMWELTYEYFYINYKTKEIILGLYAELSNNIYTEISNKDTKNIENMMVFYMTAVENFIMLLNKHVEDTKSLSTHLDGNSDETNANNNIYSAEIKAQIKELADLSL